MPYDTKVADRIRTYLIDFPSLSVEEKKMFGGLAFLVNGKMCVNVSGENLMCRFDPKKHDQISNKLGYQKVIMKGREFKGYCYVKPDGFKTNKDFSYWMHLCLEFNEQAKSSRKK